MRRFTGMLLVPTLMLLACSDTPPTVSPLDELALSSATDNPCPTCAFGPRKFIRGPSDRIRVTFVPHTAPIDNCTLGVEDDGVLTTSVQIWLNGAIVVERSALLGPPSVLQVPVTLLGSNTIEVAVRGGTGHFVRARIECGTRVTIAPDPVVLSTEKTQQFSVAGAPGPYTWSVNGVNGGNSTFGTIDAAGMYRAPTAVPTPVSFPVCVSVTSTPTVSDCATLTIVPPPSLVLSPDSVALPAHARHQFIPSGAAGPYIYSVNGVDGGNAVYGTVDANGVYLAPNEVPDPTRFPICVRVALAPGQSDCSTVAITLEGVVVYNDAFYTFSHEAFGRPDNALMFHNLINFVGTKPRASGSSVVIDWGHGSLCQIPGWCEPTDHLAAIAASEGLTLTASESTDFLALSPDAKVLILWQPTKLYSTPEINALKRFVLEGGRIVFIGGPEPAYTQWGAGMVKENDFLSRMGAQLRDAGGSWGCQICSLPVQGNHQVTAGMTQIYTWLSAGLQPGPYDAALYSDWESNGGTLLAAVAQIDPTPLP